MHPQIKLGKLAPKRSLKVPALGSFLHQAAVPAPPSKAYWEYAVRKWGMMRNDTVGDCTCAAAGHMVMNWTAHGTGLVLPTDDQVIQAYSAVTGYDPAQDQADGNPTDNGAAELDVLNYWRTTGVAGHKISGFATLDVQNIEQIKQAIYLFGGVYAGFQVPQSVADNPDNRVWDKIGGAIEGGHAVPIFGYGAAGCALISWGEIYRMSWEFWQHYVDEAYALLSPDWFKVSGISPAGLDLAGLQAALAAI